MNISKIKNSKSLIFLLSFSFFTAADCQSQTTSGSELKIPDAFEQNRRLGGGANVGSILYRWDIWDEQREKEELDKQKQLGLKGVRINTRPYLHAEQKPPYTLSQTFFERLDWLVNESLERGFTVIIDQHQYRVI